MKKKTETNGWEETGQLMNELVKSQIALAQQTIALGQQNISLGQRLHAFAERMDRIDERMRRFEANQELMIELLHRLPDAVKEKMGFAGPKA